MSAAVRKGQVKVGSMINQLDLTERVTRTVSYGGVVDLDDGIPSTIQISKLLSLSSLETLEAIMQ